MKGLLFLLIAFALNFMVFSTLFVINKEFQNSAPQSKWSSLAAIDNKLTKRKKKIGKLGSSSKSNDRAVEENKPKTQTKLAADTISTTNLNHTEEQINISNGIMKTTRTKLEDSSAISSSLVPYYLKGKTQYKRQKFHRKKTFERIKYEKAKPIDASQKVWVLPDPVQLPTRNHESILLEYNTHSGDKQILVNVLGRYARGVQWMDLETGEQRSRVTNGTDPDKRPLNDLNHVASVLVDSIDGARTKKEVWLPCGFHNDRVGKEVSSNYARIVDLETMEVRTGPKLPHSGGACGAAPIEAIPGEPPLVCAFGGTNGNHDTGK